MTNAAGFLTDNQIVKDRSSRIAAIDIGSNTVHMVIMDLAGAGLPQHRTSASVILKLGAVVTKERTLPPAVYRKLRHTLKRFIRRAKKDKALHVLITASQAMRALRQGERILSGLSNEISSPFIFYLASVKQSWGSSESKGI